MDSLSGFTVRPRRRDPQHRRRRPDPRGQRLGGGQAGRPPGRSSACACSTAAPAASPLTAEGSLFLERSRRILAEIEATELELSQRETPRGRLGSACRWSAGWSCRRSPISCRPIRTSSRPRLQRSRGGCRRRRLRRGPAHRPAGGFAAVHARTGRVPVEAGRLADPSPATARHAARKTCCGTPACTTASPTPAASRNGAPARERSPPQIPVSMVCNNIETRVCFALRDQGIACLPDSRSARRYAKGAWSASSTPSASAARDSSCSGRPAAQARAAPSSTSSRHG